MRKKITVFAIASAIMLALSLWTGAYAAKASTAIDPSSILDGTFLAQLLGTQPGAIQLSNDDMKAGNLNKTQDENQQDNGLAIANAASASPDFTETPEPLQDVQGQDENATVTGGTDDSEEITGVVTAVDASTITVDGVVYNLDSLSEVKGVVQVGNIVKLEFITNPDGSFTVSEVKASEQLGSLDNSDGSGEDLTDDHQSVSSSGNSSGGEFQSGSSSGESNDDSGPDD